MFNSNLIPFYFFKQFEIDSYLFTFSCLRWTEQIIISSCYPTINILQFVEIFKLSHLWKLKGDKEN